MLDLPEPHAETTPAPVVGPSLPSAQRKSRFGLAARLLIATTGSVLLAMSMFYSTRLAVYRETWLHTKLAAASSIAEAFASPEGGATSAELDRKILDAAEVRSIVILAPNGARSIGDPARANARTVVLDEPLPASIAETFRTMFAPAGSLLHVVYDGVEVTFDQTPLAQGMWRISRSFLAISLIIAGVVTCVLWAMLWSMVLRPVRRLTSNIIAFGENPQDVSRVIAPSGRTDEIGRAETALAGMQGSLAHEMAQRKRLAELGLAVARINHDLRNMLAAAQLLSDRLATIRDPLAQQLAPRLVATLDRAIQFCQATLTYGAGSERTPKRRRFDLNQMVREIVESGVAGEGRTIEHRIEIPPRFEIYADPDQIMRVIENLLRNAAQALRARGAQAGRPLAVRCAAIRGEEAALIEISDTGPGIPAEQAARIFEPFHGSTSDGGTGLGLAIAADLVNSNGGSITIAPAKADDFYCGARFLIKLPTPERTARRAARALPGD